MSLCEEDSSTLVTSLHSGVETTSLHSTTNCNSEEEQSFTDDHDVPEIKSGAQIIPAAKFLLQLREGHQIAQVAIANIVAGTRTLCKNTADEVKAEVVKTLSDAGVCYESIPGLQEVLDKDYDHFRCIDTNYLYEKFCLEHFGIVESCIA